MYRLNQKGWALALAASVTMLAAGIMCVWGYGLDWPTGIFCGISLLCFIVTLSNYLKEISLWKN